MPENSTDTMHAKTVLAVLEDGLSLVKEKGTYKEFQQRSIEEMNTELRGLGNYLKQSMDKAETEKDRDRIFDICYITYHFSKQLKYVPPKEEL